MAGRIRSIKPEVLEDEEAVGLSDGAWRLWISLWTLVDDHGNARSAPRWLAGQVWWVTGRAVEDVEAMLAELVKAHRIEFYTVRGERYLHVRNWDKHQRIDNAGKPRVPPMSEADPAETRGEIPRTAETRGDSPPDRSSLSLDLSPGSSPSEASDAGARVEGRPKNGAQRKSVTRWAQEALGIFAELNAARRRVVPGAMELRPTFDALAGIAGRLDAGKTPGECIHVIAVYEAEVRGGGDAKWFNQVTPWRPENFEMALSKTPGPPKRDGPRYKRFAEPMDAIPEDGET
jgi:hypothetical protein